MCVIVCVLIFRRQPTQVYTIYVFKQAQAVSRNDNLLTAVMRFQQNVLFFFGSSTGVAKTNWFGLKLLFLAYFGNSTFQDKAGLGIPKPCFRGSKSVQAFCDTCSIFVYGSCPFKKQRERGRKFYIYIYVYIYTNGFPTVYALHFAYELIDSLPNTHIYICIHHSFLYTYVIICARLSPHTGAKVWHLLSPRQIGPDRRHCQDLQWARSSGSWSTWQAGHQRPLFRDWRESTPHGDVQDELHQRRRTEGGLQ